MNPRSNPTRSGLVQLECLKIEKETLFQSPPLHDTHFGQLVQSMGTDANLHSLIVLDAKNIALFVPQHCTRVLRHMR